MSALIVAASSSSSWWYVGLGWAASGSALFGYAAWVVVRGRRLSRVVPPEERRWS